MNVLDILRHSSRQSLLWAGLVVVAGTACVGFTVSLVRDLRAIRARHRATILRRLGTEERTPVDRPVTNAMNAPVVMALFYVGGEMRRASDAVNDMARVFQASAVQVPPETTKRIATVLRETSGAVLRGAVEVEESA